MNSAIGPRHTRTVRHRAGTRSKAARQEAKAPSVPAGRLFTFTIDADTAYIVKFELLDASGSPREPSDEEKTTLLSELRASALEELLERAFEAGIACGLGENELAAEEITASEESDEDTQLHHLLLSWLIEHSDMKGLLQGGALGRTILETLIQHSMKQLPATRPQSRGTQTGRITQGRTN
jgi:hypothetical protein